MGYGSGCLGIRILPTPTFGCPGIRILPTTTFVVRARPGACRETPRPPQGEVRRPVRRGFSHSSYNNFRSVCNSLRCLHSFYHNSYCSRTAGGVPRDAAAPPRGSSSPNPPRGRLGAFPGGGIGEALVTSKWVPRGDSSDIRIPAQDVYSSAERFRNSDRRNSRSGGLPEPPCT